MRLLELHGEVRASPVVQRESHALQPAVGFFVSRTASVSLAGACRCYIIYLRTRCGCPSGPTILAANPQPSNAVPTSATDPTPAGAAAAAAAQKSADRASSPVPSSAANVAATAQPPSANGSDAGSTSAPTASNGGAGGGSGGAGSSGPLLWGVYALCGAVYQIRDLDEAADPAAAGRGGAYGGPGGRAPYQGHLVTMIKVRRCGARTWFRDSTLLLAATSVHLLAAVQAAQAYLHDAPSYRRVPVFLAP